MHSLSKSNSLRTGRSSIYFFLSSFLGILLSPSNGQTVSVWVQHWRMLRLQTVFCLLVFFVVVDVVSLVDTGETKTRLGGGPQTTRFMKGSEVLVPEGTGGLCHSRSCTRETGS